MTRSSREHRAVHSLHHTENFSTRHQQCVSVMERSWTQLPGTWQRQLLHHGFTTSAWGKSCGWQLQEGDGGAPEHPLSCTLAKGETASPLSSGLGLSQTQSSPLVLAPGPPCHPLISSPASLQYSLFFAPQTQVLRTEFPLLPFNSAPLPTSLRLSPHCKAPCPLPTLLMRGSLSECQSLGSAPIYLASVTVP